MNYIFIYNDEKREENDGTSLFIRYYVHHRRIYIYKLD